jgi:hypothetical protein
MYELSQPMLLTATALHSHFCLWNVQAGLRGGFCT